MEVLLTQSYYYEDKYCRISTLNSVACFYPKGYNQELLPGQMPLVMLFFFNPQWALLCRIFFQLYPLWSLA